MGVPSIAGWLDNFILPGTLVSLDMLTEHHAKGETICSKGGPGMAAIFGLRWTNYFATDSPERLLMREDYLWRDRVSVQLVWWSMFLFPAYWGSGGRAAEWSEAPGTTNSQGSPWCAGWRWKSGRVRILATIVTSRLALFPNLSTIVVLIPYSMQMGEEMIHEWHHHWQTERFIIRGMWFSMHY